MAERSPTNTGKKQTNNEVPSKIAPLPRRHKAIKRPPKNRARRIVQVDRVAARVGRKVFELTPRARVKSKKSNQSSSRIRNPGKDVASHVEMEQAKLNSNTMRRKSTKNQVK